MNNRQLYKPNTIFQLSKNNYLVREQALDLARDSGGAAGSEMALATDLVVVMDWATAMGLVMDLVTELEKVMEEALEVVTELDWVTEMEAVPVMVMAMEGVMVEAEVQDLETVRVQIQNNNPPLHFFESHKQED